jgi:hypothetical protein
LQRDGGEGDHVLAGEALLSGRVWHHESGGLGLFFQATYLGTGEVLGVWECAREDTSSVADLAAWCRTLRIPAAFPLAAENPRPYLLDAQQAPVYPGYLPAPNTGARGLGNWRAEQLGKLERLGDSARGLWDAGQKTEAIDLLEGVWLRRSAMPEADQRCVPDIALQLAAFYDGAGERRGQETVLAWLLENDRWRAVRGLTADVIKDRLAKARGQIGGRTRAAELAARQREPVSDRPEAGPSGSHAMTAVAGRAPPASSANRMVSVTTELSLPDGAKKLPPLSWAAPLPALLDPASRREPMARRSKSDPLMAVRPSIGREFGYLFDEYATAYAAYLAADYRAYQDGRAALVALRQKLAAEEPALDLWKTPVAIRGHDANPGLYWVAPPGSDLPTEGETFVTYQLKRLRETPYLMSKAYRLAPSEATKPVLGAAKTEVLDLHDTLKRNPLTPAHRFLPAWYQLVALEILAEGGDEEARGLHAEARTLAAQLLPAIRTLSDDEARTVGEARARSESAFGLAGAYSSALLLLATHGDDSARSLCGEDRILTHIVGRQTECRAEDMLRLLLDLGCRKAFPLSLAHNAKPCSISNPKLPAFLWRSAAEIGSYAEEFGALLDRNDAARLRDAGGRPAAR